jgi:hypothetical protein
VIQRQGGDGQHADAVVADQERVLVTTHKVPLRCPIISSIMRYGPSMDRETMCCI